MRRHNAISRWMEAFSNQRHAIKADYYSACRGIFRRPASWKPTATRNRQLTASQVLWLINGLIFKGRFLIVYDLRALQFISRISHLGKWQSETEEQRALAASYKYLRFLEEARNNYLEIFAESLSPSPRYMTFVILSNFCACMRKTFSSEK